MGQGRYEAGCSLWEEAGAELFGRVQRYPASAQSRGVTFFFLLSSIMYL